MKKTAKRLLMVFLSAALLFVSVSYQKAKAYTPSVTTLKIGLYYGGSVLPSANLQNVTDCGSGYQFGTLDGNRQFVPLGAGTSEIKISMLRDRNMVYDAADNKYNPGSEGSAVVGCYHIQLNTTYATYAEAQAAVSGYQTGFVKYLNGFFCAMIGNYISAEAANAAISSNGIGNCTVNCGTSNTVTVVKTGTNTILFEFDCGTSNYLVVMPVSQGGEKCQTWFKDYRYYGGFLYARLNGGDITVINVVDLEDYTKCVIPWEMVGNAPLEAYKAQAVCARSYAIANINRFKSNGFDLCTTEECQVYRGTSASTAVSDAAVDQTAGLYMTHNGQLCIAYYSSCDGGATENSENVWKEAVPYLRGVIDPYEADIAATAPGYSWTVTYTPGQITTRLRNKNYNCGTIVSMTVSQTTDVGNVYKVTLLDSNGDSWSFTKGETIRTVLGVKSIRFTINGSAQTNDIYINNSGGKLSGDLQSSYAIGSGLTTELLGTNKVYAVTGSGDTVEVGADNQQQSASDDFTIRGTGMGHNVGMSQWGAYSMAKYHNMTYDQILKFYFTGVTIG